jgi:hypothetical protein
MHPSAIYRGLMRAEVDQVGFPNVNITFSRPDDEEEFFMDIVGPIEDVLATQQVLHDALPCYLTFNVPHSMRLDEARIGAALNALVSILVYIVVYCLLRGRDDWYSTTTLGDHYG